MSLPSHGLWAMPSSRALAFLLVVASLAGGCVTSQREDVIEARAAHRACVEKHPEDADRACAELKAEVWAREERYMEDSRGVWGCQEAGGGPCVSTDRSPRIPY